MKNSVTPILCSVCETPMCFRFEKEAMPTGKLTCIPCTEQILLLAEHLKLDSFSSPQRFVDGKYHLPPTLDREDKINAFLFRDYTAMFIHYMEKEFKPDDKHANTFLEW